MREELEPKGIGRVRASSSKRISCRCLHIAEHESIVKTSKNKKGIRYIIFELGNQLATL